MSEILFLAHRVPFPPNRGDKIRAHHLLRRLACIGPIHVGCFVENDEDRKGAEQLAEIATTCFVKNRSKPLAVAGAEAMLTGRPVSVTAFASAQLAKWVCSTLRDRPIDTIVVFSGQMGQYVPEDFSGRVIIDLCDVDSAKFESYAEAGDRPWLHRREGRLLARDEERLGHRADAITLITNAEAELYRSRLRDAASVTIRSIGNGIDTDFFDPSRIQASPALKSDRGPHFVFTGQMDYPPNEQAMIWAIKEFLPVLRRGYPGAMLHIVGRKPTRALLSLGQIEGVRIWGEVPDVRPYIKAADFVLAPLLIARGVQNKVLEAMALAKPVLLTPQAATGIEARDGVHWLVEDLDPSAMVQKIDPILSAAETRTALGERARRFVVENHAWGAMLDPFERIVRGEREGARDAA